MTGWDFLSGVAAIIWGVSWWNIVGIASFLYLGYLLWRVHVRRDTKFDVDDLFVDAKGRADLYKVIVTAMAVLSAYTVVKLLEDGKPVETLLLGVLAIFVTGRAFTAAFGKDVRAGDEHEEGKQ